MQWIRTQGIARQLCQEACWQKFSFTVTVCHACTTQPRMREVEVTVSLMGWSWGGANISFFSVRKRLTKLYKEPHTAAENTASLLELASLKQITLNKDTQSSKDKLSIIS